MKTNIKFSSADCIIDINKIIAEFKFLSEVTQPQNVRRAAFLGYTTLSIIIKQNENNEFMKDNIIALIFTIVGNILTSFKDNDAKIVYSASESLFNIVKYFTPLVIYFFNEVFEGLLLINVNPDLEVRSIAQNLDSQLKEIVTSILQDCHM